MEDVAAFPARWTVSTVAAKAMLPQFIGFCIPPFSLEEATSEVRLYWLPMGIALTLYYENELRNYHIFLQEIIIFSYKKLSYFLTRGWGWAG